MTMTHSFHSRFQSLFISIGLCLPLTGLGAGCLAPAWSQEAATASTILDDEPPDEVLSQKTEPAIPTDASPARPAMPRVQWWMFTSKTCVPCAQALADFRPWLQASGWQVEDSATAHVRLVDAAVHPALHEQFHITAWPTFVLLVEGREVERRSPYPGRDVLVERYLASRHDVPPQAASTTAAVAATREREAWSEAVRETRTAMATSSPPDWTSLVAAIRSFVGTGIAGSLEFPDRQSRSVALTSTVTLVLPAKLAATCNTDGETLHATFAEPRPLLRIHKWLTLEQPISGIRLSAREASLELPRMIDFTIPLPP